MLREKKSKTSVEVSHHQKTLFSGDEEISSHFQAAHHLVHRFLLKTSLAMLVNSRMISRRKKEQRSGTDIIITMHIML